MGEKRRRAHSIEELAGVLGSLAPSEAQIDRARPYVPRKSDVIITPYGKCGTTMMQQMFHQLRTANRGGDMEFDDISRVVPWIETAPSLDLDINAEQAAEPRGFKSHLSYESLPPGAKYVVTLRDPKEAFVSMYNFFSEWFFEPGTIAVEDFMPVWMIGGPSRTTYFEHLLSWYARRSEADTLLMNYRGVIANKREAIRRMAEFCAIGVDDAAIDLLEHRTSRAFMVEHKAPFADPLMRRMSEEKAGLPAGGESSKVRAEGDRGASLPDSIADEVDRLWREQITPVTGHASYSDLAGQLEI